MKRINKWIVDKYLIDTSYQKELLSQLENESFEIYQGDYIPFLKEDLFLPEEFKNNPVGIYGSFEFVREYTKKYKNILSFGATDNFKCSTYLSYSNTDFFLNNTPFFTTFSLFEKNIEKWMSLFSNNIFIRPDSGFKTFTGLPLNKNNCDFELNSLKRLTGAQPETLILVSSGANIQSEYRLIVCDKKVVGKSSYMINGKIKTDVSVPNEVLAYAKKYLEETEWTPDSCFVMDIARLKNGDFYIIEFNAFSHSDFYESNFAEIFDAASRYLYEENCEID